nr:hypothetical protein [Tanacetum cinerariifolium]
MGLHLYWFLEIVEVEEKYYPVGYEVGGEHVINRQDWREKVVMVLHFGLVKSCVMLCTEESSSYEPKFGNKFTPRGIRLNWGNSLQLQSWRTYPLSPIVSISEPHLRLMQNFSKLSWKKYFKTFSMRKMNEHIIVSLRLRMLCCQHLLRTKRTRNGAKVRQVNVSTTTYGYDNTSCANKRKIPAASFWSVLRHFVYVQKHEPGSNKIVHVEAFHVLGDDTLYRVFQPTLLHFSVKMETIGLSSFLGKESTATLCTYFDRKAHNLSQTSSSVL